jgi:predicted Rossmann fold nucleotide-binding protein DprA/Smf involved in DNA uptake
LCELLNWSSPEIEKPSIELSATQIRVLDSFGHFEQRVEHLANSSGLPIVEASFALESLEKLGVIGRTSSGWVKLSNTL